MEHMRKLGYFNVDGVDIGTKESHPEGAFARLADWALYELGLYRLVAKCYQENEPSRRMLSAVMRQTGEDETFCYFEKRI